MTGVQKEGFVDFGEAFEDGGVGDEIFAHSDEGPDDIYAHGDGTRAVEDIRRHQRAMFGEGER